MNMFKTVIFDIDGTLANCEWRQGFLRSKPRNWLAFKNGSINDTPHEDVIWMLKLLHSTGNKIIICSARTEDEREATVSWLNKVGVTPDFYERLYLREEKDYRDDGIVKKELLEQMRQDGFEPDMVFDDRDRVVKMWRENGIRCFQVNYGDF